MIPVYPQNTELTLAMRSILHPMLQQLADGISEFTFANLYLFRQSHNYRISQFPDGQIILTGSDGNVPFFMSPFGLPEKTILAES